MSICGLVLFVPIIQMMNTSKCPVELQPCMVPAKNISIFEYILSSFDTTDELTVTKPQNTDLKPADCLFPDSSLLNYLRNPQCTTPSNVWIDNERQCVYTFEEHGFSSVECENNQAVIRNGCVDIFYENNATVTICP